MHFGDGTANKKQKKISDKCATLNTVLVLHENIMRTIVLHVITDILYQIGCSYMYHLKINMQFILLWGFLVKHKGSALSLKYFTLQL